MPPAAVAGIPLPTIVPVVPTEAPEAAVSLPPLPGFPALPPRALEPGMVLTIEPGLYIADFLEDIDPAWHGIGIRIEDDVLVTASGNDVLTAAVPKAVDDLEAIRRDV